MVMNRWPWAAAGSPASRRQAQAAARNFAWCFMAFPFVWTGEACRPSVCFFVGRNNEAYCAAARQDWRVTPSLARPTLLDRRIDRVAESLDDGLDRRSVDDERRREQNMVAARAVDGA